MLYDIGYYIVVGASAEAEKAFLLMPAADEVAEAPAGLAVLLTARPREPRRLRCDGLPDLARSGLPPGGAIARAPPARGSPGTRGG